MPTAYLEGRIKDLAETISRYKTAVQMRKKGASFSKIGKALKRDRSCVARWFYRGKIKEKEGAVTVSVLKKNGPTLKKSAKDSGKVKNKKK